MGSAATTQRLHEMIRTTNGRLKTDALLKAGLGVVFSLVTFGFVFLLAWLVTFFRAWYIAASITAVFVVVAFWSAWNRVNPLADVKPMTDQQHFLTALSLASPDLLYFSPRHASAGLAVILIGGPSNILHGLGTWASQFPADDPLVTEAARLLGEAADNCPVEQIRNREAAFLLRRLALVKVVPHGDGHALTLTDQGWKAVGGRGKSKPKSRRGTPP